MTAFVNPAVVKSWKLNGREISNAVTAARTLTKGGALTLSHLERVVAAEKRDDDVRTFPAEDMKKKTEKKVATETACPTEPEVIITEEPKSVPEVDPWEGWGSFGTKKKKEQKAATEENKPREVEAVVVEEPIQPPEDDDFGWGSFGSKKKKGKKAPTEEGEPHGVEVIVIEEPKEVSDYDSTDWAGFAKSACKKPPKKGKVAEDDVPPPPPPPEPEADWSFGTTSKSPPAPAPLADSPAGPAAGINDWDFWASSKKTKKKKAKKPVVWADDIPSVPTEEPACDVTPIGAVEDPDSPVPLTGEPVEGPSEGSVLPQVFVCEHCINSEGQIRHVQNGFPCEICQSMARLAADMGRKPPRPSSHKMCKCCIGKAVLKGTYCRFCGSWEGQKKT